MDATYPCTYMMAYNMVYGGGRIGKRGLKWLMVIAIHSVQMFSIYQG